MSNQVLLGQALRSIVLKGSKETEERYERELAAAEADRKKAEAEFRAAGAVRIKEIKQRIGELSAEIRQAAPQQKRTLGEEIKKLLVKQAAMPVLWETSVRNMVAGGVDIFVEVGPGKVLTGFTKKIAKGMMALNVEDAASLEKTLAELNK